MTLKVVVDNVAEIGVVSHQDFAGQLRTLADALDQGKIDKPTHLLVILDGEESMDSIYFGAGLSDYARIGLLQTAAQCVLNEITGG